MTELLDAARASGHGVGAFNVFSLEHAQAEVRGAELAGRPVVLQLSENAVRYHGSLEPVLLAVLATAREAEVPVVVHLDHVTDVDLIDRAIALGCRSVMFDASRLDYRENVNATTAVVRRAHAAGVAVEAELGEVGGKDGVHRPDARTDPTDAAAFVAATGVNSLAVAVGSSHAMTERTARLDLGLVAELRAALPVPLVLHGSSGVDDEELVRSVRAGLTKINIATHLNSVFTATVRRTLAADPALVDTRRYLGAARDAVALEVARLLGLLASA